MESNDLIPDNKLSSHVKGTLKFTQMLVLVVVNDSEMNIYWSWLLFLKYFSLSNHPFLFLIYISLKLKRINVYFLTYLLFCSRLTKQKLPQLTMNEWMNYILFLYSRITFINEKWFTCIINKHVLLWLVKHESVIKF